MKKYTSVTAYLADLPTMQREVAEVMRDLLADAAPDATEVLSYNMPAIKQNGQVLVYFSAAQKHLGFYPTPDPIEAFASQLKGFQTSKGTIQIPYNQPLPVKLIREIVAFRVKQVEQKR